MHQPMCLFSKNLKHVFFHFRVIHAFKKKPEQFFSNYVTSLTQTLFLFLQMLAAWARSLFLNQSLDHKTLGNRQSQSLLASSKSSIPMLVFKGRVCQGQSVSGNTSIHRNCRSGEKNKQRKRFQGNQGKIWTEESGKERHPYAKGKQMEETRSTRCPRTCRTTTASLTFSRTAVPPSVEEPEHICNRQAAS